MKRMKNYMVLSLLVAVMVLTGCSKSSESPKLIPADAFMTARIDVKQMLEKSKAGDNDQMKQKIKEAIQQDQMGADLKQKLEKIIDDPAKAGLDLRNPLFAAMSGNVNNPDFTLTGTVLDSGDLNELLTDISMEGNGKVEERDGVKYFLDDDVLLAFDDDNFVATQLTASNTLENVLGRFGEWANTELLESEEMQAMMGKSGVLQVLVMGRGLASMYDEPSVKAALPSDADPKDLSLLIDFSTGKGKIEAETEVIAKSEAWEAYIKKGNDLLDDIDGDALKYVSKQGIVVLANVDGDDLYEVLSQSDAVSRQLGRDVLPLLEKVLKSIDGDLAVGINIPEGRSAMPSVTAYVKTKDQTIVNEARSNGIDALGVQIGYDKGFTYLLFGSGSPFAEQQNTLSRSNVSGMRFYVYIDFAASGLQGQLSRRDRAVLEYLSALELGYKKDGKGTARLTLKDDSKDPLELLLDALIEAIG